MDHLTGLNYFGTNILISSERPTFKLTKIHCFSALEGEGSHDNDKIIPSVFPAVGPINLFAARYT